GVAFGVEKPAIADLEPGDRSGSGFTCGHRYVQQFQDFFSRRHLTLKRNSRLPICGNACRRAIAPLPSSSTRDWSADEGESPAPARRHSRNRPRANRRARNPSLTAARRHCCLPVSGGRKNKATATAEPAAAAAPKQAAVSKTPRPKPLDRRQAALRPGES